MYVYWLVYLHSLSILITTLILLQCKYLCHSLTVEAKSFFHTIMCKL